MKKAKESGSDIDMTLLFLRTIPVNYHIQQSCYITMIKVNLPVKIRGTQYEKDKICEGLCACQAKQKSYNSTKVLRVLYMTDEPSNWHLGKKNYSNKWPRPYNVTL